MEALKEAPRAQAVIEYEQKDITADLAPFFLGLTYTDRQEGQADELELRLSDEAERWANAWFPTKGDRLVAKLGRAGEPLLPCGLFSLDELTHSFEGATVTLRGQSAEANQALRTKRQVAYEAQELRQVAEKVAARHGLKVLVQGAAAGLRFDRLTQARETDVAFLARLAAAWGFHFSIRGNTLVFIDRAELDAAAVVLTLPRERMKALSFTLVTNRVYRSASIQHLDPKTGRYVTHTESLPHVTTGDSLRLHERVENKAQAIQRCKAALRSGQGREITASLNTEGDRRLVAGANLELTGVGKYGGRYQVREATHTLDRAGSWRVTLEASKLP